MNLLWHTLTCGCRQIYTLRIKRAHARVCVCVSKTDHQTERKHFYTQVPSWIREYNKLSISQSHRLFSPRCVSPCVCVCEGTSQPRFHSLTWFYMAVVPGNGRVVGVTPGAVFVFVRVSAVASLQAGDLHAPLTTGHTQAQQDSITSDNFQKQLKPDNLPVDETKKRICVWFITITNKSERIQPDRIWTVGLHSCVGSVSLDQDKKGICEGITHWDNTHPPTLTYLIHAHADRSHTWQCFRKNIKTAEFFPTLNSMTDKEYSCEVKRGGGMLGTKSQQSAVLNLCCVCCISSS